jgi:hypothetical protein
MTVYLAKFELNNKHSYKIGHTKFYYANKRFEDEQYNKFDKITIMDEIRFSDPSAKFARDKAKLIEICLQSFFPKNFYLEEYYNTPNSFFDNLSGITEMFILNSFTEAQLLEAFKTVKTNVLTVL